MSVYITMKEKDVEKNRDFVIYNYITSQKNITQAKLQEDLRKKYGLKLDENQIQEIILYYVRNGVLSPRLRYYKVKNKV